MRTELDPGYDPKGYRGSQGRGPAPKLADLIGEAWRDAPTELEYEFAERGLGLESGKIPVFGTNAELQVWVFRMHSLRGSKEHFQELADRTSPKPSRLQGLNESRTTRGATSTAPQSEQEKWFGGLEGLDDEDTDADLL